LTNQVENIEENDLVLPDSQPADDHVTSEVMVGPASMATSDQQEHFMTPHGSTPSMHSLSNSSQPTTPSSNTAIEEVLISDATLKHNDTLTLNNDITDSGFVIIHSSKDSQAVCGSNSQVDVMATLKPTDLTTTYNTSDTTGYGVEDEESEPYDIAMPTHMSIVGIHGDSTSSVGIHGDNAKTKASMQVEDQVIGISNNNFSINPELSLSANFKGLSSRRRSGTLPDLKITKYSAYGANSPEYYTPTDSELVLCFVCSMDIWKIMYMLCVFKLCLVYMRFIIFAKQVTIVHEIFEV